MFIDLEREARDQDRDVWQLATRGVSQIIVTGVPSPRVERKALEEHVDVVALPLRNVVEVAQVVDLPRDARVFEQVEDAWVVKDAESPNAIGGDSTRGSGRQVEAVRPGRAQNRAEVVDAEGEAVVQRVIERQLPLGVVAKGV